MARAITTIGILCSAFLLNAQQEASPGKPLRFGVNLMPAMAYRELIVTENSPTNDATADLRDSYEKPRWGYGANVYYSFALSRRFLVEGGLGYSDMGYKDRSILSGDLVIDTVSHVYHFHYVEVPIRAAFSTGTGRVHSITAVGLTISNLLRTSDGDPSPRRNRYSIVGLFPTLSTGVSYTLSDRVELRLEPNARYGVLPISDSPITAHLWSVGIGFGALWTL